MEASRRRQKSTATETIERPLRRRRRGDPGLAVAYIRVSTEDQRQSPDAQRASIESWAARNRTRIMAWFTDEGLCGDLPEERRPALGQAILAVRELGAAWLIVKRRDRLARGSMVAAILDERVARYGGRIVASDGVGNGDAPEDVLFRRIVDGMSEYELSLIRARTTDALAAKRLRFERVSRFPPYGYKLTEDKRHIEAHQPEQAVLELARRMRQEHGLSLRRIARELGSKGYRNRHGGRFHPCQIELMVSGKRDPNILLSQRREALAFR